MLQEWVSHFDSDAFGDFVLQWMTMSKVARKMLSHNGAVRYRSGDPCHDHCPHEKVDYFDPTNMNYSVALNILAPRLESDGLNCTDQGRNLPVPHGFELLGEKRLRTRLSVSDANERSGGRHSLLQLDDVSAPCRHRGRLPRVGSVDQGDCYLEEVLHGR